MLGSTESALIWRRKVTPAGHTIFRLAPWTPPTSAIGCTGAQCATWPTPTSLSGGSETSNPPGNSRSMNKTLELLYGPDRGMNRSGPVQSGSSATTEKRGAPNQSFGAGGTPLPSQMHRATWGTPEASDVRKHSEVPATVMRRIGKGQQIALNAFVSLTAHAATWPTPTTTDSRRGNGTIRPHDTGIPLVQRMAATANLSGPAQNGSSATTEKRGAPNPGFAMWLMGFPDRWVAVATLALLRRKKKKLSQKS